MSDDDELVDAVPGLIEVAEGPVDHDDMRVGPHGGEPEVVDDGSHDANLALLAPNATPAAWEVAENLGPGHGSPSAPSMV